MKALVFAAGVGSRLKPFTDSHPKALVEVGGRPMLALVIEKIVRAGIRDIIVNVHHFADQIIDFLRDNDFGAKITISDERDRLLETGGGLLKALEYIGNSPVLIHNADILTDFALKDLFAVHSAGKGFVTLLTADRATSRKFVFDGVSGSLSGWTNLDKGIVRPATLRINPDHVLRAFDGVHVLDPDIYPELRKSRKPGEPFSITDFYIDICDRYVINRFDLPKGACWFDVGKPETLARACDYMTKPSSHND